MSSQDVVDMTFSVAERIAQFLLDAAESTPFKDDQFKMMHDTMCWAAYKVRTGAWREGWERDPAGPISEVRWREEFVRWIKERKSVPWAPGNEEIP